eukprot:TRINITY_DN18545_c0_g1_i2.p1 TRINITY_DN18545_c0_g1~~TRINITY_DN18545_c0_g1_i2.p1  ORF type:complete len:364 (+),score=77.25 TRINITY_DN18545_c0_g1_i2:57-1148(+)
MPVPVEPRSPASPTSPTAPRPLPRTHPNVAKHLAQFRARVYMVVVGDKATPGRRRREKRFLIATAAWLFLMSPDGKVKRAWGWASVELNFMRSMGRIAEILVKESGEKDVVLRLADPAPPEASHDGAEALELMKRLAAPFRPLPVTECHPRPGSSSLADEVNRSAYTSKPSARSKVDEMSPRSPVSPLSSPPVSPSVWNRDPPEEKSRGPTDWERGVLGFSPQSDPSARPRPRAFSPPPDELTPEKAAAPPPPPVAAAPPAAYQRAEIKTGARVLVDNTYPGTVERPFSDPDLSSPFGGGGLVSERMARHMHRAEFWWVILDAKGEEEEERAVLRKASTLTILPDLHDQRSGGPLKQWDGGWA